MGNQWHFDPDTYLAMVRSEIPRYDELQLLVADSTAGVPARRILDLGSGTGRTAQAVLRRHPSATLVGVDGSEDMLAHARRLLPESSFVVQDLSARLPSGPFDVVVSAFAVHHLDAAGKAALFRQVGGVLAPGGRFVLCDVVVPTAPVPSPVPLEDDVDRPSTVDEQLRWLEDAGLSPAVVAADGDLAVLVADRVAG